MRTYTDRSDWQAAVELLKFALWLVYWLPVRLWRWWRDG